MEPNLIQLHTIAGLYCGEQYTCGKKVQYSTEETATMTATALNKRPEHKKKYEVEPYPCPFCNTWHVGRKMSIDELNDIKKRVIKNRVVVMKENIRVVYWGHEYDRSPHALLLGNVPEEEMQEIRVLESSIKTAREDWKKCGYDLEDDNKNVELHTEYMKRSEILENHLKSLKYQYIQLSDIESIDLL